LPAIIPGDQLFLQNAEKRMAVFSILDFFILEIASRADSKTVFAIISLRPPTVQGADINDTV